MQQASNQQFSKKDIETEKDSFLKLIKKGSEHWEEKEADGIKKAIASSDKKFDPKCTYDEMLRYYYDFLRCTKSHRRHGNPLKKWLLIGEGNLSFAVALFRKYSAQYPDFYQNLVVTVYESKKEAEEGYNGQNKIFSTNYQFLLEQKVEVLFKVDARKLNSDKRFVDEKTHEPKVLFDRIQFNCPYGPRGENNYTETNYLAEMLESFFQVAQTLQPTGGRIHVTISKEEDAKKDIWRQGGLYNLGNASVAGGYLLKPVRYFGKLRTPIYQHSMSGRPDSTKTAKILREFIFVKSPFTPQQIKCMRDFKLEQKESKVGYSFNVLPDRDTDYDTSDAEISDTEQTIRNNEYNPELQELLTKLHSAKSLGETLDDKASCSVLIQPGEDSDDSFDLGIVTKLAKKNFEYFKVIVAHKNLLSCFSEYPIIFFEVCTSKRHWDFLISNEELWNQIKNIKIEYIEGPRKDDIGHMKFSTAVSIVQRDPSHSLYIVGWKYRFDSDDEISSDEEDEDTSSDSDSDRGDNEDDDNEVSSEEDGSDTEILETTNKIGGLSLGNENKKQTTRVVPNLKGLTLFTPAPSKDAVNHHERDKKSINRPSC